MKIPNVKIELANINDEGVVCGVWLLVERKRIIPRLEGGELKVEITDENKEVYEEYREYITEYLENVVNSNKVAPFYLYKDEKFNDHTRSKINFECDEFIRDGENYYARTRVDGIPTTIVKIGNDIKLIPAIKPRHISDNVGLILNALAEANS